MAIYNDAIFTNAGKQLIRNVLANEDTVIFTRIVIGKGTYTAAEKSQANLITKTSLKNPVQSYDINYSQIVNESYVRLGTLITNYDPDTTEALINTDMYMNEIGIMAKGSEDTNDVLYGIVVCTGETGDYIPGYTGENPIDIMQDFSIYVNSQAEVTIVYPETAYARATDLADTQAELEDTEDLLDSAREIMEDNLASEYNESVSYTIGDYCIHEHKMYICEGATTGEFDSTKWAEVQVGEELQGLKTSIKDKTDILSTNFASTFDTSTSYSIGDLTTYNNTLYRCKTAHTGAWNASHFKVTDVESEKVSWKDNGILGAKNLLNLSLASQTKNNVTFTVNIDNTIYLNNAASSTIWMDITGAFSVPVTGKYTLTGCPSAGNEETYCQYVYKNITGTPTVIMDVGSGGTAILNSTDTYIARIRIKTGVDVSNTTFKPMLRLASDNDDTYQPYAMTNKTLTENVDELNDKCNGIFKFSINLNSEGWYRIGEIYSDIANLTKGFTSYLFDIDILRAFQSNSPEIHKVTLLGTYNNKYMLYNKISKSSNAFIQKMRIVTHDDNHRYIDVFYNSNYSNRTIFNIKFTSTDNIDGLHISFTPNTETQKITSLDTGESVQFEGLIRANDGVRQDITNNLTNLSAAVSAQDLGAYGYSIGDYFTGASGYTYILADMNAYKGKNTPYCLTDNHIGIVVDTDVQTKWETNYVGAYYNSALYNTLAGTVLNNIKSDFITLFGGSTGLEHLYSHTKLLTFGLTSWNSYANQYISALTCTQIDAGSQWDANGWQEGEASKSLELFRKYKWTEVLGNKEYWLRNYARSYSGGTSVSELAVAAFPNGSIRQEGSQYDGAYALGLILFH